MKILIKNEMERCEGRNGVFTHSPSGKWKKGYHFYDDKGRRLGIVFMSDNQDKKSKCKLGKCELLYYPQYENEFGTWQVVKIDKDYLDFKMLEVELNLKGQVVKHIKDKLKK